MSNRVNFNPNLALDANHEPASSAVAYFYDTGTSNAQTVYTDSALTVGVTSLAADSSGEFADIFSADTIDLKVVVKDSGGSTLYTIDPAVVQTTGGGASSTAFTPTSRISSTNVQAAVEEVDGDVEQLEKDARKVYATAGSSDAYTVAVTGVSSYNTDDVYTVRADRDNNGAATLNIQSVGAKDWQYYDDTGALAAYATGQIVNGNEYKVVYDGTRFVTIGHRSGQITTSALQAGTDTNPGLISPAGVKASVDAHVIAHLAPGIIVNGLTTGAGALTTEVWKTVDIDGLDRNVIGGVLTSDEIDYLAGSYFIKWLTPCDWNNTGAGVFSTRLYNVTDAAVEVVGQTGLDIKDYSTSPIHGMGVFTLADTKSLRFEVKCVGGAGSSVAGLLAEVYKFA